ncbi:LptF/LptG family permease [candidate division KSB1 bacterium]|nr:LptF/LptG family permease [candidate division KSB1 bacterium]
MYILQRYIIKQHIGPFIFGFMVITLIWILNLLFTRLGDLISRGLPILIIFEFFILNIAWIIALALPMAVLMACLMAFGQMSADHEITAIKASGISLYKIISPILIIATLLCALLIYFNNDILPEANHRLALLMRDIHKKRPTISLEPGIIYREIPDINLLVNSVDEREHMSLVKGVMIQDQTDPEINKTIIAESGEIKVEEATGIMKITLYNGEVHEIPIKKLEEYRRLEFPKQVLTITVPDIVLTRSESDYRGDREQSSSMMRDRIKKNKESISDKLQEINTLMRTHLVKYFPFVQQKRTSPIMQSNLPSGFKYSDNQLMSNISKQIRQHKVLSQQTNAARQVIENYKSMNSRLSVEVHKKYSIPFACIVFVLIGAPLGIMARRGGMAVGGGISLLFFIIYWSFLIGGEELADRQYLSPFIAMWIANILVGSAGVYLVIHTVKEMTTFNLNFIKPIISRWKKS